MRQFVRHSLDRWRVTAFRAARASKWLWNRFLDLVQRRLEIRAKRRILRQPHRWGEKRWKRWELDLLGTAPDAELAARFGRSENAVRVMRWRRHTASNSESV